MYLEFYEFEESPQIFVISIVDSMDSRLKYLLMLEFEVWTLRFGDLFCQIAESVRD